MSLPVRSLHSFQKSPTFQLAAKRAFTELSGKLMISYVALRRKTTVLMMDLREKVSVMNKISTVAEHENYELGLISQLIRSCNLRKPRKNADQLILGLHDPLLFKVISELFLWQPDQGNLINGLCLDTWRRLRILSRQL